MVLVPAAPTSLLSNPAPTPRAAPAASSPRRDGLVGSLYASCMSVRLVRELSYDISLPPHPPPADPGRYQRRRRHGRYCWLDSPQSDISLYGSDRSVGSNGVRR